MGIAPPGVPPPVLPQTMLEDRGGEDEDVWRWYMQASEGTEEDDPSPLDPLPSSTTEREATSLGSGLSWLSAIIVPAQQEGPPGGPGASPQEQAEAEELLDEAFNLGVPAPMALPYELMYPAQAAMFVPPTAEEIAERRRAAAAGRAGGPTVGRAEAPSPDRT